MSGGTPAVLPPRPQQASASTALDDERLEERVRSLRLSSIPQGSDWLRSLVLLIVGVGFLGVLLYLVRETLQSRPAGSAVAAAAIGPSKGDSGSAGGSSSDNSDNGNSTKALKPSTERQGTTAHEAQGYIIPAHQILVSPQVSGRIIELHIEEGRRVEKGEVLAKLESTEYEADVERAKHAIEAAFQRSEEMRIGSRKAEIQQAEAELGEAQAQLAQLRSQWERENELRKNNAINQQQFEVTEGQYRALEHKVVRISKALELWKEGPRDEQKKYSKALHDQAKAELVKAEWRLSNCTIRAPISGTILKKNAEEGNIVNPIAFNGSFSLCDMADLSDLEVDLNVQETDLSRIFKGQKCIIRPKAYPDRPYDGYVSRLMPIADRAKGAVPIRVKLTIPAEEEGIYLKPEMSVTVTFLKGEAAVKKNPPTAEPMSTPQPDPPRKE